MPTDKMFGCGLYLEPAFIWVLLAPGLASCFCFITEGFIESMRKGFEAIGRCRGKIW
jgi:hypothetical protein